MSIRHITRANVRNHHVSGSRLFRLVVGAVLLVGSVFAQASLAADADNLSQVATLAPLHPDSGPITVAPGQDITLSAIKKFDDQGVVGQNVDWTASGPGSATLAPAHSKTSAKSDAVDQGVASTVFRAVVPGSYVVTATTQKNPGCSGASCATYVSIRYTVSVAGAAAAETTSDSSGVTRTEVIGAAVGLGAAIAAAVNSNNNSNNNASGMRTLALTSGDGQSAAANTALPHMLVVHAENNGFSTAGIGIQWSVGSGAVLSAATSVTDDSGFASIKVQSVGPGPGPITITATRSDNSSATVSFTANVLQPSLVIVSGDGQSGTPNTKVASPLVVEAGLDNDAQVNVPITWAVTSGSAAIISSDAKTNASGQASATVRFGATPGPVAITATRADGSGVSQTFHLNSVDVETLVIVSGNNQSGFTNTQAANPLDVQALGNGIPEPGLPITWAVTGGSAMIVSSTTPTNANGQSHAIVRFGATPGPVEITATLNDGSGRSQTFQLTATVVQSLVIVSGDKQSGPTNTVVQQPLIVKAIQNTLPQVGAPMLWSVSSGSATILSSTTPTDSNGESHATVRFGGTPGLVEITAMVNDGSGRSQTFQLTSTQTNTLAIVSGDGQTGAPNAQLKAPLVVQAKTNGHAIGGVTINWSTSTGSLSALSSMTGPGGNASITVTNTGDGSVPVVVTATRSDDPTATVTFTENVLPPTLTKLSGDGQSGLTNTTAPNKLVVKLVNASGTPVANQPISWTVTQGTANLASQSTNTGPGGAASVGFTFGNSPGNIQITASAYGGLLTQQFNEMATSVTALQMVSGDGQTAAPGATLTLSVRVVAPPGSMVLKGVPITFTVLPPTQTMTGTATVTASPVTTLSSGVATTNLIMGSTPGKLAVVAQVAGGGPSFQFTETVSGSLVQGVMKISSGNNQTLTVGTPSAQLVVVLTANTTNGPPLAGQQVNWSTSSGTLSAFSSLTDPNGRAFVNVTPTSAVPINVTASFPSHAQYVGTQITFAENTAPLVVGALTIASGNNQAIALNTASAPLVVTLKENGAPLAGQPINWSTSTGTLTVISGVTDGNGQASATVTPTASGPINVIASFPGHAQFAPAQVTFSENSALTSLPTQTTNDQSVSVALDTACSSLQSQPNRTPQQQDLLNQCLALSSSSSVSTAAAAIAVHQLIPDVTQTQSQTATTATTAQFNNLAGRMTELRGGAQGVSLGGLQFSNDVGSLPLFDVGSALLGAEDKPKQDSSSAFSRWGFFASGQIGRQDSSSQGGTPAYKLDINGLTFGVDYRESEALVLGGAFGYTRQTTTLAGDDGNLRMNGWSLSGYATWYQKNNWYLDSSITWANNNYDSQRHIAYTLPLPDGSSTSVDQLAAASSGGNNLAGSLTFGRDFNNKAWAYGFYGKAQYSRQQFDAFQEQLNASLPGSGLGLRVDQRTITQVDSVLGAKVDHPYSTNWGVVIPHAEVEWQHEFDGNPSAFRAFFEDDPTNTPILITGTPIDSDFFRLGLGVSFVFPQGRSAFILYDRTLGQSGITAYNLSLGFRMEF